MMKVPGTPGPLHGPSRIMQIVSLADEFTRLKAQADRDRVDLLRAGLRTSFTFASVAEAELQTGNREAAELSLADAEKGYATVSRFLSDQKHAEHISKEIQRELAAELERLRQTLDELRQRIGTPLDSS